MNNERKDLDVLLGAIRERFDENSFEYRRLEEQAEQWLANGLDIDENGLSKLGRDVSQLGETLTSSRLLVDSDDVSLIFDISRIKHINRCIEIPAIIEINQEIIQKEIKYSKKSKYRAVIVFAEIAPLKINLPGNKKYVDKYCFFNAMGNNPIPVCLKDIKFETSTSVLNIDGKEVHMRGNSYSARIASLFFGKRWVISKVYQTDELYEKWENSDWMRIGKAERIKFRESLRQAERNFNDRVRKSGIYLGDKENLIIGLDNRHYVNKKIVDRNAFNR